MKTLILLLISLNAIAQCPTHVINFTDTQCFEDSLSVSDEYIYDCPSWYHGGGFIYQFEVYGNLAVSIIVNSDLEYTSCPDCSVFAHAIILDDCGGNTVWSSTNGNCGGTAISTNAPLQNWYLDIELSEGIYYLAIGNVGAWQTQDEINGCFTIWIGNQGVLSYVKEFTPRQVITDRLKGYDLIGRKQ